MLHYPNIDRFRNIDGFVSESPWYKSGAKMSQNRYSTLVISAFQNLMGTWIVSPPPPPIENADVIAFFFVCIVLIVSECRQMVTENNVKYS